MAPPRLGKGSALTSLFTVKKGQKKAKKAVFWGGPKKRLFGGQKSEDLKPEEGFFFPYSPVWSKKRVFSPPRPIFQGGKGSKLYHFRKNSVPL